MLATVRDLQHIGSRLERVENQAGQSVGVIRTLLKMLAEAAARESRMRREMVTMRAQLDELYARLVAIEDAPMLTDEINAGEPISEAARG